MCGANKHFDPSDPLNPLPGKNTIFHFEAPPSRSRPLPRFASMCTPTHRITAPFSPLDMHPHPSHLASPQTPHLAPPPFPAHPALKPTRPDSPPPAPHPPHGAIRTHAASPEPLEAHDVTEKNTEKPRLQDAHVEHAATNPTLASQGHLARPANWDSMTRTARKHWKIKQAKHKKNLHK